MTRGQGKCKTVIPVAIAHGQLWAVERRPLLSEDCAAISQPKDAATILSVETHRPSCNLAPAHWAVDLQPARFAPKGCRPADVGAGNFPKVHNAELEAWSSGDEAHRPAVGNALHRHREAAIAVAQAALLQVRTIPVG